MNAPDGFRWSGWMQPADDVRLLGVWSVFIGNFLHYVEVRCAPDAPRPDRDALQENALNSLVEATKDLR